MGASEFTIGNYYTYDDICPVDDPCLGQTDPNLTNFSIGHDEQYIIPLLNRILALNPNVKILATPWSPPAWMKSGGSLEGGTLRMDPEVLAAYAAYFVDFIQAYQADGISIDAVSVQNEPDPDHQPQGYPAMALSPADEATFIRDYLGPASDATGLSPRIIIWDHNWDNPGYPLTVLQDRAVRSRVQGVAFHCYAGNETGQAVVQADYPDMPMYVTERTGFETRGCNLPTINDAFLRCYLA
jgi:glucosylceramidase